MIKKNCYNTLFCINGELKPNSVLFWDEPESNINPTFISVIVDVLIDTRLFAFSQTINDGRICSLR